MFPQTPKNSKIQNSKPPKIVLAYVAGKIQSNPPPPPQPPPPQTHTATPPPPPPPTPPWE